MAETPVEPETALIFSAVVLAESWAAAVMVVVPRDPTSVRSSATVTALSAAVPAAASASVPWP